jgi:hypothetical protein
MSRILCANYFGEGTLGRTYRRLARVLAFTATQHCPGWDVQIHHLERVPAYTSALGNASHVYNAQNLAAWDAVIQQAREGDEVLFLDADTMIVNPLDPVWDAPFDVAYTVRTKGAIPLNAGVVAVRVSDRTRRFCARWSATCQHFLRHEAAHRPWRRKYKGINQSSLGALLEAHDHGCQIAPLTCLEWNCENTEWASFDPRRTRIVHLKSGLRRAILGVMRPKPEMQPLVAIWRELDAAVGPDPTVAVPAPRTLPPSGPIRKVYVPAGGLRPAVRVVRIV